MYTNNKKLHLGVEHAKEIVVAEASGMSFPQISRNMFNGWVDRKTVSGAHENAKQHHSPPADAWTVIPVTLVDNTIVCVDKNWSGVCLLMPNPVFEVDNYKEAGESLADDFADGLTDEARNFRQIVRETLKSP